MLFGATPFKFGSCSLIAELFSVDYLFQYYPKKIPPTLHIILINYFKYLTILQLSIFFFFFFFWLSALLQTFWLHLPFSVNCSVVVYVLLQFKAYLYHSFHPKDHKETLSTKPKAMLALNLLSNSII